MVMPMPNSVPPTSSDSQGSSGRCGMDFARSTCPASASTVVPAMATATASIQLRMRVHEPMLTMSDSAPIVQKLMRAAVAPNTKARAKPPSTTTSPRLALLSMRDSSRPRRAIRGQAFR